jgi:hypothetical protein
VSWLKEELAKQKRVRDRKRKKEAKRIEEMSSVVCTRLFFGELRKNAQLYFTARGPRSSRPVRNDTKRRRARQAQLRRVTMRSAYAQHPELFPAPAPSPVLSEVSRRSFQDGLTRREARIQIQGELRLRAIRGS